MLRVEGKNGEPVGIRTRDLLIKGRCCLPSHQSALLLIISIRAWKVSISRQSRPVRVSWISRTFAYPCLPGAYPDTRACSERKDDRRKAEQDGCRADKGRRPGRGCACLSRNSA